MVSIPQIESGVARYLDSELISQLPEGQFSRLAAGTMISLAIKRSSRIIEKLKENTFVKMLDIFDGEGNVDLEVVKEAVLENMTDAGLKIDIPVVGTVTFKRDDVEKLYKCILG